MPIDGWNNKWTKLDNSGQAEIGYRWCMSVAVNADYVDQGWPVAEFLIKYPENYGLLAEGIWAEIPGYTAVRIGFMKLLDWGGTLGYMNNDTIWPDDWWIWKDQKKGH
ncbi:hypothetical protein PTTG_26521 [Puccinia triticina 1-1 BBBD Race 1]|uniref:Uncharacterized protein n=1 Tax=Puccinia triticina (isolate 1-1 / race 1 (BBBD)) TaxID=630390 RepID=A0A180GTT1_PUCT1|nr:hypothetical protein PTTG_26521 [Puccinia triticina 1-1 BBBD Race 1]